MSNRRAKSEAEGSTGDGRGGTGQHLQAAIVTSHEALEQGRIQAVQVGDRVGDGEGGLQIEMQGAVSERRKIHQRSAVMNGLQSERQIDGDAWWRRCRLWRSRR